MLYCMSIFTRTCSLIKILAYLFIKTELPFCFTSLFTLTLCPDFLFGRGCSDLGTYCKGIEISILWTEFYLTQEQSTFFWFKSLTWPISVAEKNLSEKSVNSKTVFSVCKNHHLKAWKWLKNMYLAHFRRTAVVIGLDLQNLPMIPTMTKIHSE